MFKRHTASRATGRSSRSQARLYQPLSYVILKLRQLDHKSEDELPVDQSLDGLVMLPQVQVDAVRHDVGRGQAGQRNFRVVVSQTRHRSLESQRLHAGGGEARYQSQSDKIAE